MKKVKKDNLDKVNGGGCSLPPLDGAGIGGSDRLNKAVWSVPKPEVPELPKKEETR